MSAAVNFRNSLSFVRTVLCRMRWATPLLFAVGLVAGSCAMAAAQQTGPEPGNTDPVGSPAAYLTLRTDDLAFGNYASANVNQLQTYQTDTQSKLSSQITAATGTGVFGQGDSLSASGRILAQDNDQLVNVGRSADGSSLEVRFPLGGAYDLPGLHPAIKNTPDQVSVAVGDLDKIADANGQNHDEVVVAYASPVAPGAPIYYVNLAVLNYTTVGADGSQPLYVTKAVSYYALSYSFSSTVSDTFSVAIGDFDGNGQNEIALATVGPSNSGNIYLSIFRYIHAQLTDTPALQEVTHTQWNFKLNSGGGSNTADFLPTISLMAGDFAGTGSNQQQLVLALENRVNNGNSLTIQNYLQAIAVDTNLNPTLKGHLAEDTYSVTSSSGTNTCGKLVGLAGLFKYDPPNGFDLYRREIALVNNERQPVSNDSNAKLDIKAYQVASDLSSFTPMFNGQKLQLPDAGVGAKFAATAGGLPVNANIATPLWSLATAQFQTLSNGTYSDNVSTIGLGTNLSVASTHNSTPYFTSGSLATDNGLRPAVQAYDFGTPAPVSGVQATAQPTGGYVGRTILFGAPVRLTVYNTINTDFVMQEPPKHALWCESAQPGCDNTNNLTPQAVNVISRVPTIAVSLTTTQGNTFSGKSTDTTAASYGGSEYASASISAGEGQKDIYQIKTTVDVSEKAGYNYDSNKSSYNSNYAQRTLTEADTTDNDDFLRGRAQNMDIWRYRALGLTTGDSSTPYLYYDCVMPGPIVEFHGSGLDMDWYQPLQENGNILSYPSPSNSTFTPPDLGPYERPCPSGAGDCTNGLETVMDTMIPATAEFISNTSGTIGLDYSNNTGSGDTVSYSHKITTSLDIKYTYQTSGGFSDFNRQYSGGVSFNSSNSWGNTTTSDSTTTSSTGIKISRSAISSAQAYEFFPTVYTTLDGTIKVSHAVDPLASSSGKGFWSSIYGGKPDPALNLPLRFVRANVTGSGTTWIANGAISRKQMRGFFLMTADPNPVTGDYDILADAPIAGDPIRVSAQVYNYSTAQSFKNCLVQFYAIQYNSGSNTENGERILIGQTTVSLPPRGTAPAQIIWDTTNFGPSIHEAGSAQDWRIYVDLNYDNSLEDINGNPVGEIYAPENPAQQYGAGLPLGVDPGQNDEGWGLATVMSPATSQANPSTPVSLRFGATPLAIVRSGRIFTRNLSAQAGAPTELRAQVCAGPSGGSRIPADLLVFDGNPANGSVIAWKRLYVTGKSGNCESTWFNWTPTSGNHSLVAAVLPTDLRPSLPSNVRPPALPRLVQASLKVNVP